MHMYTKTRKCAGLIGAAVLILKSLVIYEFRIFHPSCSGADLGLKLRQRYIEHLMSNGGDVKVRRIVQTQIRFLELLHDKINHMLITYQNANTKLGKSRHFRNGSSFKCAFS